MIMFQAQPNDHVALTVFKFPFQHIWITKLPNRHKATLKYPAEIITLLMQEVDFNVDFALW